MTDETARSVGAALQSGGVPKSANRNAFAQKFGGVGESYLPMYFFWVCFFIHRQGLLELFLTVSWDLWVKCATPDGVLVSLVCIEADGP